jgi:hypothetical protein
VPKKKKKKKSGEETMNIKGVIVFYNLIMKSNQRSTAKKKNIVNNIVTKLSQKETK